MIYVYKCETAHYWEVIKSVREIDREESCPDCGKVGGRVIQAPSLDSTLGDWNRVEYNPGLGCWTKSWKHGREIAKRRGMEEVGDEHPDKIHKHFDTMREEKREQRWRDADRVMKYE